MHRDLIHREHEEELETSQRYAELKSEEELTASGKCLPKVLACDTSIGLFGRTIVEFKHTSVAAGAELPLPPNKFRDGDLVSVRVADSGRDESGSKRQGRGARGSDGASAGKVVATGLVSRCTDTSISVAFDDDGDDDEGGAAAGPGPSASGKTISRKSARGGRKRQGMSSSSSIEFGGKYRLDTLSNDVTLRRCEAALSALGNRHWLGAEPVVDLMFGSTGQAPATTGDEPGSGSGAGAGDSSPLAHSHAASPASPPSLPSAGAGSASTAGSSSSWHRPVPSVTSASMAEAGRFVPQRETLNPSQRRAVQAGLASEDLVLIHGPPGTGKTSTLVELIAQLVARGNRVLACAPSNVAVDNLAERLADLPMLP